MRGKYSSCSSSTVAEATQVVRNYIGQEEGVTIPTWAFFLLLGTGIGVVVGPALMATTATGSARLAELSRQYIERK
ncbi:hypothetical protein KKH23_10185 [Patescibacteria group bacterium]|nr:hypothetical protein [Patescibacteria group bacterium]